MQINESFNSFFVDSLLTMNTLHSLLGSRASALSNESSNEISLLKFSSIFDLKHTRGRVIYYTNT